MQTHAGVATLAEMVILLVYRPFFSSESVFLCICFFEFKTRKD
jgi:hypothetical protein